MAIFHVQLVANIIVEAIDVKSAGKIAQSQSMEDIWMEESTITVGDINRIDTLARFNTLNIPGWVDTNYPYGGDGRHPINKILK